MSRVLILFVVAFVAALVIGSLYVYFDGFSVKKGQSVNVVTEPRGTILLSVENEVNVLIIANVTVDLLSANKTNITKDFKRVEVINNYVATLLFNVKSSDSAVIVISDLRLDDKINVSAVDDDGFGDDYYESQTVCNMGEKCILSLTREGFFKNVTFSQTSTGLIASVDSVGLIKEPIVCFGYPGLGGVYRIFVPYSQLIDVPDRLYKFYDECFAVNESSFIVEVLKENIGITERVRIALVDWPYELNSSVADFVMEKYL